MALLSANVEAKDVPKAHVVAAILVAEAGGEANPGMQAVLNVLNNRARIKNSILFVYQAATKKWQFSAYNRVAVSKKWTDAQFVAYYSKHPKYEAALHLIRYMVMKKLPDVTGGATHYFNPRHAKPSWAPPKYGGTNKKAIFTVKIGQHVFFRNVD